MKLFLIKKLSANSLPLPLETEENSPSGYNFIDVSLLGKFFGGIMLSNMEVTRTEILSDKKKVDLPYSIV